MEGRLPADAAIDAEVDLGTTDGVYGLAARFKVSLPGMDRQAAQGLVDAAITRV
jgi:organic hydroperoxide reductase OsmC/OhrA